MSTELNSSDLISNLSPSDSVSNLDTKGKYYCKICKKYSKQKGHHDTHLNSEAHKNQRKIFELELEKLSKQELIEKYGCYVISKIVQHHENYSHRKFNKGTDIWNLGKNPDNNPEYESYKNELSKVIKKCHNELYSKKAITGSKAMNDILKVILLKFISNLVNSGNLIDTINELSIDIDEDDKDKYLNILQDISKIKNVRSSSLGNWSDLVRYYLSNIFKDVFNAEDLKFNHNDTKILESFINEIDSLKIDDEFYDAFTTSGGDIYESFTEYSGGTTSKALGQFFTPRKLIDLTIKALNIDKLVQSKDNISIYDPCMGSGGYLARLHNSYKNKINNNIYGCEIEADTFKFGYLTLLIQTKSLMNLNRKTLINSNSLSQNDLIYTNKFDAIVTNPPFGTKMNYDQLKQDFISHNQNSTVKFEDIYPLKTNNGACLFVQHCVYMLTEGGFCAIVLPDGELFEGNSKWSKTFRKWFSEQVNIRTILKVASGTFEHAGVKTNVVVFTKDGPTKNIHFMETPKECNVVKDMFTISAEELKSAGYSLDIGEYLVEETDNYDVPMVALGNVCDIINGSRIVKKNNTEGIYPVFGSGNQSFTTNTYNREGNTTIIGRFALSEKCVRIIKDTKLFLNDSGISINCECPIKHKYISYYLLFNQNIIYNLSRGQAQKNLNMDKFKELKIPLPSQEIQQQIVDELSQIETSIETIESRIAQLNREKDQYKKYGRKAEIRELLKDSEEKMLGEVCEFKTGIKCSLTNEYDNNHGRNLIRINNLCNDNKFIKIGDSFKDKYKGVTVNHNDILIASVTNGYLQHKIVPEEWQGYNFNGALIKLYKIKINVNYLYFALNYIENKILSRASGVAQKNLSIKKIEDLKIPQPSHEIQQQCIELFEEKEKFIQSIDDKINSEKAYIEELKQMAKDVISSYC